jgi:hypothetical protein
MAATVEFGVWTTRASLARSAASCARSASIDASLPSLAGGDVAGGLHVRSSSGVWSGGRAQEVNRKATASTGTYSSTSLPRGGRVHAGGDGRAFGVAHSRTMVACVKPV